MTEKICSEGKGKKPFLLAQQLSNEKMGLVTGPEQPGLITISK